MAEPGAGKVRYMCVLALAGALLLGGTRAAGAADLPLAFDDPLLQARYARLLEELRCLVCQNQSLADSHAELAQDLRSEVHAMVAAGRDDEAIVDFLVDRYGNFVLYRPPLESSTSLLWIGPFVLLVVAAGVVFRRRRGTPAAAPLDAAEQTRLAALLARDRQDQP